MRYFVTGATGFIGKRLVRALLSAPGNEVWFLARAASADTLTAAIMLGMAVQLAAPHMGQIIMNTAYRLSADPDSASTEGALPASPELRAMQHLLHGVHL